MSGTQCCENPPSLSTNSGSGHVTQIGGIRSYVSGSTHSHNAVILISDVFGYEAPKLRKLADKIAAADYYVVVPDYFHGEPYNPSNTERPIPVWLKDHGTDKGYDETIPVIEALKHKGLSKIGAAGFCWGGKVVTNLAKGDYIQAGIILHPGFVTVDDIKDVKVPFAVLAAEIDHITPPELVKEYEQALNAKPEVDSFVKIFPGVAHGWTVRYNPENPTELKLAEEAHQDLFSWLLKHVK